MDKQANQLNEKWSKVSLRIVGDTLQPKANRGNPRYCINKVRNKAASF